MSENPTSNSGAGLTPGYRYYRHGFHYIYAPCMTCGLWWRHTARNLKDCRTGTRHKFRACTHLFPTTIVVQRESYDPIWSTPISHGISHDYLVHNDAKVRGDVPR